MGQRPEAETTFLNVDLDVEAPYDLAPLVEAMGDRVFDLRTGPVDGGFGAHLELAGGANHPEDAETGIQEFVNLLRRLPEQARRLWTDATRRDFNIGVQGGTQGAALEVSLAPDTVAAVAEVRARVVVTVYPADLKYLERKERRRTRR